MLNPEKPVPNEPDVLPATDANRRKDANLAPQGDVDLGNDSSFTPEGDGEPSPNIPDDIV